MIEFGSTTKPAERTNHFCPNDILILIFRTMVTPIRAKSFHFGNEERLKDFKRHAYICFNRKYQLLPLIKTLNHGRA